MIDSNLKLRISTLSLLANQTLDYTTHIQSVKNQLTMEHAVSNCNGKIWVFWNMDIDCVILKEDEHQITCDFSHNELQNHFIITFMPQTTITHLPSVGSDHCPLLMEMTAREEDHIKYFKFLNCWADQPKFLDIVKAYWERTVEGNNIREFGDILTKVREYEERVRTAEENLIQEHNDTNKIILHEFNVEYIRFLKIEDSILKQKTQLHWFKEGDCNTKYFHSLIRGRRRKLFIHKLIRGMGNGYREMILLLKLPVTTSRKYLQGLQTHQ
ncbi:hypothetical protein H5410_046278 [Solanum commersonii]|uniref:Uncharacterized protein n=1 Tax=Solanum commersonii TaxID=4109 RepID=A0A9J5XF33_SOLCO|nr:hypothetical protein H5410_046278 [Solanum commersonii]